MPRCPLPTPPVAARRPHVTVVHGVRLEDPYHWLRDPAYPQVEDPEILGWLEAENAYQAAAIAPVGPLVDALFAEMRGRIKEDDASVPMRDGDWLYWWAFEAGAQYRRWFRKRATGGPDELILDEPREAEAHPYFRLGAIEPSPDGRLLATNVDTGGSERFTLAIREAATGRSLETVTRAGIGEPVWTPDGRALIYLEVNERWRRHRARLHRLGEPPDADLTIYEETEDVAFQVGISRSQDRSLIFFSTGDHSANEVRFVPASNPAAELVLIARRRPEVLYEADAAHGRLWILANDAHPNFRLAAADPARPDDWETVIPGSDRVYLRGLQAFRNHLLISERVDGLDQIRLRSYVGEEHRVAFPEASYTAYAYESPEWAPEAYRLGYTSLVTPATVFDYHPAERRLETLKVQEVPSGHDPSRYRTERLMVPARDGTGIPVTVVHPADFPRDGSRPLDLHAYGAYGIAVTPAFSVARLSLLNRGFACAIAHIRGGDDLGRRWYLDGKLEQRWNAFTDFVDVARGLVARGFTAPGRIAIRGGSAGGELMGVVVNTDPELWGAVVADVPFVDVLNTMLDETLPLTPGEWREWGNPREDRAAFDLIRSYSPYENVRAQPYPPMLVTTGLSDPRVTYWEAAKWVARLRATRTNDTLILLKTNMQAGHGGKSGRWERLRETAEALVFVLSQLSDRPV
jgi:oligopeptidase B